MTTRAALVRLAVFVAIVSVCGTVIVQTLRAPIPGGKSTYQAVFTDVSGLYVGNDVRIAGVPVGKVEAIDLERGQARVRFTAQSNRPVYSNSGAAVRYQNLVGERYMELFTQGAPGTVLSPGSTIPVERTVPSFDVSKLFNGFKPLFNTLSAAELNRFVHNILQLLQGDGSGLGPAMADVRTLTDFARNREAIVTLLIHNLGLVADQIGGKSGQVDAVAQQLDRIINALVPQADGFIDSARRVVDPLRDAVAVLEQAQAVYDTTYGPLDGLLRRLVPSTDQLVELMSLVPSLFSSMNTALAGVTTPRTYTCAHGPADIPGIGAIVLGNQNLMVCR